jgi:2-polyprenyl-6-hydroxyphenyl methylase/3-demethylubiquinone-9 3-methyltransferase
MAIATIRPDEAAHFGQLAAEWWNPAGSSAMLHKLNPVRLAFVREAIDAHWRGDSRGLKPLAGKTALDVGCGAGLLCEPLARLGAGVTGVDAAEENIAVARLHAEGSGLLSPLPFRGGAGGGACGDVALSPDSPHPNPSPEGEGLICYGHGDVAQLGLQGFDLVTSMEVLEHVADKAAFVGALATALAPKGLMILSTPNRTPQSRLLLVEGAERLGMVPRGTHHWDDFATPDELRELLAGAGLTMGTPRGIAWSPGKGLHLSDSLALNYVVTATRV